MKSNTLLAQLGRCPLTPSALLILGLDARQGDLQWKKSTT